MDQFSRTVLPAAAKAGIRSLVLTQHMPTFRRCIEPDDTAVLLTEGDRPEAAFAGGYLLLFTQRRLLVSRQSRVSGRIRIHLDVTLDDLDDVVWFANDRQSAVEFAATVGDTRHRFFISRARTRHLWHVNVQFNRLFGRVPVAA